MKTLRSIAAGAALIAACTFANAALADNYTFSFQRTDGNTLTFGLSSNTPYVSNSPDVSGNSIKFSNVSATYNNAPSVESIYFFEIGSGGGFAADVSPSNIQADDDGPQLYQLTSSGVDFLTGTFPLTGNGDAPNGSLTIADTSVSAAPEPGTWALMMLGVGAIGAMLGYRKRVLVDHKAKLAVIA